MLPAVIFFKLKYIKKIYTLTTIVLIFFLFYIYGNHSINLNNKKIRKIDNKINIKVISPNFKLEYGLDQTDIENRLKKLIKYSDPSKDKNFICLA